MSREDFAQWTGISGTTLERFDSYTKSLVHWNNHINLVAPSTLDDVWKRHLLDSAQLWKDEISMPSRWVDIGSGGGFPGLVVALIAADRGVDLEFIFVEADTRKAAFLRSVSSQLGLRATTLVDRIEKVPALDADVISARACAPLAKLLGYSRCHLNPAGQARFLKGRRYRSELTEAKRRWHVKVTVCESVTDPEGAVITIADVKERV